MPAAKDLLCNQNGLAKVAGKLIGAENPVVGKLVQLVMKKALDQGKSPQEEECLEQASQPPEGQGCRSEFPDPTGHHQLISTQYFPRTFQDAIGRT